MLSDETLPMAQAKQLLSEFKALRESFNEEEQNKPPAMSTQSSIDQDILPAPSSVDAALRLIYLDAIEAAKRDVETWEQRVQNLAATVSAFLMEAAAEDQQTVQQDLMALNDARTQAATMVERVETALIERQAAERENDLTWSDAQVSFLSDLTGVCLHSCSKRSVAAASSHSFVARLYTLEGTTHPMIIPFTLQFLVDEENVAIGELRIVQLPEIVRTLLAPAISACVEQKALRDLVRLLVTFARQCERRKTIFQTIRDRWSQGISFGTESCRFDTEMIQIGRDLEDVISWRVLWRLQGNVGGQLEHCILVQCQIHDESSTLIERIIFDILELTVNQIAHLRNAGTEGWYDLVQEKGIETGLLELIELVHHVSGRDPVQQPVIKRSMPSAPMDWLSSITSMSSILPPLAPPTSVLEPQPQPQPLSVIEESVPVVRRERRPLRVFEDDE